MTKKEKAIFVLETLIQQYPDAECSLNFRNHYELVVAVQLSAQATDAGVNRITPRLFSVLPDWEALARADRHLVEELIFQTGFYRQKAKNLQGCAQMMIDEFGGKLPQDMKLLVKLPGVGRKTANVVFLEAFGFAQGIAVDTHVLRISKRLGLTKKTEASAVEKELLKLLPKKYWADANHVIIFFGRDICTARKPKCDQCPLAPVCPFFLKRS